MPNTDYTEAQLKAHMERFQLDGTLPENSVFNPSGETRGEPILRKMTAEEMANAGVKPGAEKAKEGGE